MVSGPAGMLVLTSATTFASGIMYCPSPQAAHRQFVLGHHRICGVESRMCQRSGISSAFDIQSGLRDSVFRRLIVDGCAMRTYCTRSLGRRMYLHSPWLAHGRLSRLRRGLCTREEDVTAQFPSTIAVVSRWQIWSWTIVSSSPSVSVWARISTDFPNSPSHCVSGAITTIGLGEETKLESGNLESVRLVEPFRPSGRPFRPPRYQVLKAALVYSFPLSVRVARGFSIHSKVRRCLPVGELFPSGKLGYMNPCAVIVDFSLILPVTSSCLLKSRNAGLWPSVACWRSTLIGLPAIFAMSMRARVFHGARRGVLGDAYGTFSAYGYLSRTSEVVALCSPTCSIELYDVPLVREDIHALRHYASGVAAISTCRCLVSFAEVDVPVDVRVLRAILAFTLGMLTLSSRARRFLASRTLEVPVSSSCAGYERPRVEVKGRQGTLGACQAKFRLSTYEGSDVMLRGHSGWVADELSLGICRSTTDGKAVCCDELSLLVLSAALVGPPPSFEPSALGKDVIAATEGPAGERASIAGGTKEWHVRARGAAGSDGESMMNVRGTASGERKRRGIARGKAGGTRGVACWGTRHKWGVRSPTEMKGGANKGRHALWIKISRVQRIMVVQVIQANTNQTAVWKHEHEFVNTTTMRDNYPLQIRRPWWGKTCGGGKESFFGFHNPKNRKKRRKQGTLQYLVTQVHFYGNLELRQVWESNKRLM
ncbi:hypothetical protein EDB84DRAFT_1676240 [Lactarius hengduanensis]|nr:hypothetical protein EDB84DRAFT_1676240 [Lactarius hengduanensis]